MSLQRIQVLPEELVLTILSFLYIEIENLHFSEYVPPYDEIKWSPRLNMAFTSLNTPIFNGAYMLSRMYKDTNHKKYYITKCDISYFCNKCKSSACINMNCRGRITTRAEMSSTFSGNELSKAFVALKLAYNK